MPDGEDRSRLTGTPNRATTPAQQGLSSAAAGPFVNRLRHEAEHRSEGRLARAQADAELLTGELAPHFVGLLAEVGLPAAPQVGRTIPVSVMSAPDFKKAWKEEVERQWRETYNVLFTHAYENFEKKFLRAQRQGSLSRQYASVPRSLRELYRLDALVISPLMMDPDSAPAGFWAEGPGTLVVLDGQIDRGVIAHELAHAYTSREWNLFIVLLSAWDHGKDAKRLDEGMTSEMADLAIASLTNGPSVPGAPKMRSHVRRTGVPSGYGGYGLPERMAARRFCTRVDASDWPGVNAHDAFFRGRISVAIDRADVRRSRVRVARERLALSDLMEIS